MPRLSNVFVANAGEDKVPETATKAPSKPPRKEAIEETPRSQNRPRHGDDDEDEDDRPSPPFGTRGG